MKSAIIYARVSTMSQDTDRQVTDLSAYATANGYNVEQVFTEKISGAKKNTDRPMLISAMEYAIKKHCAILCNELSRLGRNVWEVQENVKKCLDNNVDIYFQKERLHLFNEDGTMNPFANIMISVLGTCAQMERENIRFRMLSGFNNFRANGGKVGRKVGYRKTIQDYETTNAELVKDLRDKSKGAKGKLYSVRSLAERHGVNPSTVQAISALLKA